MASKRASPTKVTYMARRPASGDVGGGAAWAAWPKGTRTSRGAAALDLGRHGRHLVGREHAAHVQEPGGLQEGPHLVLGTVERERPVRVERRQGGGRLVVVDGPPGPLAAELVLPVGERLEPAR